MLSIKSKWTKGMSFDIQSDDGNVIKMGAGNEEGMSPMKALLGALSGCSAIDVIAILKRYVEDGSLKSLNVDAEGIRAEGHPQYYTDITLTFHIEGDVPEKRIWKAMRQSEEKFCSVRASLKSNVILKLILNGVAIQEDSV